MSASPIKIATIGTWGHLHDPIAEILTMPDAKLVAHARALPDDDIASVRKLARDESLPWFDDYKQMLREVRPDAVIVTTRIDRIAPIATDVADAGCHLICEKPLAIEHADLRRLYDAVTANKVQCLVILGNARHAAMQAAADVIHSGKIGEVVLLNARKSYKWGTRPEWFGKRNLYGGTIGWIAIHGLEMIHHLAGQEFISVAAMQSNCVHPDRPDCQDNGLLLLQLSGGGHASISFDLLRPKAAATHADDWIRIVGSRGVIEASLDRGWCRYITDDTPETEATLPPRGQYFAPFLRGLSSNNGAATADTRRGFMLTHVCLCARDAAERKTIEAIPQIYL